MIYFFNLKFLFWGNVDIFVPFFFKMKIIGWFIEDAKYCSFWGYSGEILLRLLVLFGWIKVLSVLVSLFIYTVLFISVFS